MKKTTKEITTNQTLVKKNKYNYKLTAEDKQTILLDYLLNKSKTNIKTLCNKYGISDRYLYTIVNDEKNKEIVNSYITECSKNFGKKSQLIIDKALTKLNEKIDDEKATIRDLTILTGTLYDKTRLENNLSTSNNSISINIKVE